MQRLRSIRIPRARGMVMQGITSRRRIFNLIGPTMVRRRGSAVATCTTHLALGSAHSTLRLEVVGLLTLLVDLLPLPISALDAEGSETNTNGVVGVSLEAFLASLFGGDLALLELLHALLALLDAAIHTVSGVDGGDAGEAGGQQHVTLHLLALLLLIRTVAEVRITL